MILINDPWKGFSEALHFVGGSRDDCLLSLRNIETITINPVAPTKEENKKQLFSMINEKDKNLNNRNKVKYIDLLLNSK
jgi:hypothetical protein